LKICDLTQFYSPLSGGVKRYVHEKIAFIQASRPRDEHVLVVPGPRNEVTTHDRSRIYSVRSPVISRSTQYRALLNLAAIGEIIERERPDIIESADPYQVGWKAAALGQMHRIPTVAFYHSHFPESYLRRPAEMFGTNIGATLMSGAQHYVRKLYNRFDATLVPSPQLSALLLDWGVQNVREVDLGVNTEVFRADPSDRAVTRRAHGIPADRVALLYVGRLANEKNTQTLFEAFARLASRTPGKFQLVVVGDGQQRQRLQELVSSTGAVTSLPYCADSTELAQLYRAADVLVHPGMQETFGLVTLESQACGTPVLGIRGSSMERIVMHDQQWWADENTPAALADAIEATTARDCAALGRLAAERVAERYSWGRVFDRLFCIYRDVCENYNRGQAG